MTVVVLAFIIRAWWALPIPLFGAGDAPVQPIEFSHQQHVQEVGLDCVFCHRNVTQGAAATIPAVEQCMFCHTIIDTGSPELAKLRSASKDQQPIDWKRVHRLPDHVHFVHEAHVRFFTQGDTPERQLQVGQVCSMCHGEVESMARVKQVRTLRMRDCVDCHRDLGASTDCATCHY